MKIPDLHDNVTLSCIQIFGCVVGFFCLFIFDPLSWPVLAVLGATLVLLAVRNLGRLVNFLAIRQIVNGRRDG